MNDDTKLNEILGKRVMTPPSTNLAARIIAAAEMRKNTPLIYIIIEEIAAMLVIPKPAYAVGACLVFGVMIGMEYGVDTTMINQDLFSFIEVEEGDWL